MSNQNSPTKKKKDVKFYIIVALLVTSIATNLYLVKSIIDVHNYTMMFISDYLYYNAPVDGSNSGVPDATTEGE